MSEVIVRMGMPKSCPCELAKRDEPCFAAYGIPKRWADFEKHSKLYTRPWWCPIIAELPDGHGRLGDLDILEKIVNGARIDAMIKGSDTNPYWLLGDIILQAKTIVPAERRET